MVNKKLKPVEKLADEANKGDIIRIQFKKKFQYVGFFEESYIRDSKTPYSSIVCYFNSFNPSRSSKSRESFVYSKTRGDPDILGYEILRMAEKK